MLQTRGVVGHGVGWTREVESLMAVAVGALVTARIVAQASGRPITGDGASGDTGDRRGVVGSCGQGSVRDVVRGGDQRDLRE